VLQRARPALRDGDKKIVFLTGIGGAGKSTLATRLANRCQLNGFKVISLKAREETPAQFGLRLLHQLAVKLQVVHSKPPRARGEPWRSVLRRKAAAISSSPCECRNARSNKAVK